MCYSGGMKQMAIVGGHRPSTYSKSPELWNRWCDLVGFPGRFEAVDIDRPEELPAFLDRVWKNPDFVDLTVTNPYKQQAYEWFTTSHSEVLEIASRARRLAATNHLLRGPGGTPAVLENTDGAGLLQELPEQARGTRGALVVGAGGAARSIADALLEEGFPVTIANILEDDAEGLAAYLQERHPRGSIKTVSYSSLPHPGAQSPLAAVDLAVLAITEGNPFPPEILRNYRGGLFLVDARYGEMAEGYRAAREAGLEAADGRHMLFGQFALAADTLSALHGVDSEVHKAALATIRTDFLAE
jgi:shikimate dehydrogenase